MMGMPTVKKEILSASILESGFGIIQFSAPKDCVIILVAHLSSSPVPVVFASELLCPGKYYCTVSHITIHHGIWNDTITWACERLENCKF